MASDIRFLVSYWVRLIVVLTCIGFRPSVVQVIPNLIGWRGLLARSRRSFKVDLVTSDIAHPMWRV